MQPNYRRCVSCRRVAPKAEFWRVVRVYPDRIISLDVGAGRSAYLCPQADCLRQAQRKNRLARALKGNVPEQIFRQLWERLDGLPTDGTAASGQAVLALSAEAIAPSVEQLSSELPKP